MKLPKRIPFYETSAGAPVKTLLEYQQAEVTHVVGADNLATTDGTMTRKHVAELILRNAERLVAVLSLREKGRPLNRKDSKPRKPRVVANEPKAAA